MFLTLDGIDGTGKSTQLGLLADWLRSAGHEVVACRDPGSTPLGEAIRQILLDSRQAPIARTSEMLLYMAARAQLVAEVISPALATGKTVVCDRFLLANVVYQGHAGGLDVENLWQIGRVATAGVEPDLTLLLDVPLEIAAARMNRPLDRMEQQGDTYRVRLREGFLSEAARRPERIAVIDAAQTVDAVHADIRAAISHTLNAQQASH